VNRLFHRLEQFNIDPNSPRVLRNPDQFTWWQLHAARSNLGSLVPANERPRAGSPRCRPPSARLFRPTAGFENFPRFAKVVPKLEPIDAAQVISQALGTPVSEQEAAERLKPKRATRKKGELPPGVTPSDVREVAGQLKAKLIDRFGSLTNAFRRVDVDGSGTISRDELDQFLEIVNLRAALRKDVIDVLFELVDDDNSGAFDFKEFSRVMNAGDVMNMGAIRTYYDGYEAKMREAKEQEQAAREAQARQAGMTVEEYEAYYSINEHQLLTSEQMASVARDRFGHKIKGPLQAHST